MINKSTSYGAKRFGLQEQVDEYAIVGDDETRAEAVARSIERRTGMQWCGEVRPDGYRVTPWGEQCHYVGTLGRPCGDGYTPEVQVWFSVEQPSQPEGD